MTTLHERDFDSARENNKLGASGGVAQPGRWYRGDRDRGPSTFYDGQMLQQASGGRLDANMSPNAGNAQLNIRPQPRLSAHTPLSRADRVRMCVGPETGAGASNNTAAEPYRSLPSGNRTALKSASQASLDENCPAYHRLHTKPGLYPPTANPERRTLSQKSTNIERGYVRRSSWVGPDAVEIARRSHLDPPIPAASFPGAPDVPSTSQFPRQASHYSFRHPQVDLNGQSIPPSFIPQGSIRLVSGFTLHPSVHQEIPYPLNLNPQTQAHQRHGVKILPRNWTPADPLPEGFGMAMLWNDLASAYIPHIYPRNGPWRNVLGNTIDLGLWGAPLDMSKVPPWWFSEDIDLGAPLMTLPPEVEVAQYKYDTVAECRLMVGTKPFYRFDPWADVRLYEMNEYGKLEELEMYKEWLQNCMNVYREEASPSAFLGVSLLFAKRNYQQPPGSGRIFDDETEETNGYSASADGKIDALVDFSMGAPSREESPQENIINLKESPQPATPAGVLGLNPWMGQSEHADANGYTGVLRQSVPPIPSGIGPGHLLVLQHDVPPISNFPVPPLSITYPVPALMPPPGSDNLVPLLHYTMPPPGTQYLVGPGSYPMASPLPFEDSLHSYPPPPYKPAVENPALTVRHNTWN
ncbi:hypothetical protein L211DRAFT_872154 [Terfezia boudieri ATCC MYA-4762]|uniref:Uncharacterized protein n=1 Tax=Terfezia boudieri ATCC MYA-4762 TaxID=1051890 RepID=A0A3N4M2V3_9PEZI|nr:hypothetical protein L211DRAFT_872154 [Terfezia boudieri ATCC MYA-4762]